MSVIKKNNRNSKIITNNNFGFSLIEVIIAIAILGVVMAAISSVNLFGLRSFKFSEVRSSNQFDVRMPVDFISREIRFAKEMTIINDYVQIPVDNDNDGEIDVESSYRYIYLDENKKIIYINNNEITNITGTTDIQDYKLVFSRSEINGNEKLNFNIGKFDTSSYDVISEFSMLNLGRDKKIIGTTGFGIKYKFEDDIYAFNLPSDEGGGGETLMPITSNVILGISYPVAGAFAPTTITPSGQYTGTISWSPATPSGKFQNNKIYTATITLSADPGYIFDENVKENFFEIYGIPEEDVDVTNALGSNVITVLFTKKT